VGSLLLAECPCMKNKDNLTLEICFRGGMLNFKTILNAPAICWNCKTFNVLNYLDKNKKCPKCENNVTFYNDDELFEPVNDIEDDIFGFEEYQWDDFVIKKGYYLCPYCLKKTMRFVNIGMWD
jgi:hypothetical protein